MKKRFAGLTVLTLAALGGCTQGTPGGVGATSTTANRPAFGQAEETFNLSVPLMSSTLQQGAEAEAVVGIKRGKNFGEDVELQFADVPPGVTIASTGSAIKHGDTDAKITFKATDEAQLGDFKIKVIGHPTKGGDAQVEFKLTVAAKDSFTLGLPYLSTGLKQGETQTVAITVKRAKTFDEDVALSFGPLPTGVTIAPESPKILRGEADVNVMLTAASDAALGNFVIKVTGQPTTGVAATSDLKLAVTKE